MPNGKLGDHPLTDLLYHDIVVYSPEIDALARWIFARNGRKPLETIDWLKYNNFRMNSQLFDSLQSELRNIVAHLPVPDPYPGTSILKWQFTKDSNGSFRSDSGFVIRYIDRYSLTYTEGDHILAFRCDLRERTVFYTPQMRWESPFDKEQISDDHLREIRNRIRALGLFENYPLEFQKT